MYRDLTIAVVIPAYNEDRLLPRTLSGIPAYVDHILVVDDASKDATVAGARARSDTRLEVLVHAANQGVGAAIVTGYRRALELEVDAAVVMAADAQMDPDDLPALLDALIDEDADYVKGNRLRYPGALRMMPPVRLVGTQLLAYLTRLTSGYSGLGDSQCGYTVAHARILERLPLDALFPRYGYPNDLINRLGELDAHLVERPVRPVYADEVSGLKITRVIAPISKLLLAGALRRTRKALRSRGLWLTLLFAAGLALGSATQPSSAKPGKAVKHTPELTQVQDVVDLIEDHHIQPVHPDELVFRTMEKLVRSLDRHSRFMRPRDYKRWRARIHGKKIGPGIELEATDDGTIRVSAVSPRSPAERAGIAIHDQLLAVDNVLVDELELDALQKRLLGSRGSRVQLRLRSGDGAERNLEVIRDEVRQVAISADLLEGGVAHIAISSFQEGVTEDTLEALERLEGEHGAPLTGIIIDVRQNLGGLFREAVSLADLFLPEGDLIVTQRGRSRYRAHSAKSGVRYTQPVVVLVDHRSASASELLAAALQEHERALVVGTSTYGKGSVQSTYPLPDGSGLKITTSRYYSPLDHHIDDDGIAPDVELSDSANGLIHAQQLLRSSQRLHIRPRHTTYTPIPALEAAPD